MERVPHGFIDELNNVDMRKSRLLVLGLLGLLLLSCEEFTTNMHYTLFSEDELSEICINKDSALSLQIAVSGNKTYDEFVSSRNDYSEEDTIYFISNIGDTVRFSSLNSISINVNYDLATRTVANAEAYTSIVALDPCFMYSIMFGITADKNNNSKIIYKDLFYSRSEYDYKTSIETRFEPKDSSKINILGLKYTYEPVIIMDKAINNCLIIRQYDASSSEILKIIYSRQYGFLVINDKTQILTRMDV